MKLSEENDGQDGAAELADAAKDSAEGLNNEWNKRMQEKLERMKAKKMRDMSITITQKTGLSGALASRQRKTYTSDSAGNTVGQGRLREELTTRQGKVQFMTGENDGTVDVCVQSIIANKNNPTRISLKIYQDNEADDSGREVDNGQGEGVKKADQSSDNEDTLEHHEVKSHMTRLERDMRTLNNRVRAIQNNAEFNKDQEVAFHSQSVSMNRAATYWPIIQLLVVIITGFTQANHIVRYMKTRHIV